MTCKKSADLSVRKIDDEIFVFNRQTTRIHSFNKTGAFLWEKLDESGDVAVLSNALVQHYDVPEGAAREDVAEFLENLYKIGLAEQL